VSSNDVVHKMRTDTNTCSKDRTKELISAGLHRAVLNHGLDTVAKAGDCSPRTLQKAMSLETLPEAHTLGNILQLEPTLLWEWLSELGFKIVPKDLVMSPDMKTAREMSNALTVFIQSLEDGVRDHRETQAIAPLFRHLIPKMAAVVAEADKHRVGERA
jgi:hypothetical protein